MNDNIADEEKALRDEEHKRLLRGEAPAGNDTSDGDAREWERTDKDDDHKDELEDEGYEEQPGEMP